MRNNPSLLPQPHHVPWVRGDIGSNFCRVLGLPPEPAPLLPSPHSQNLLWPRGGRCRGCWCTGCFPTLGRSSQQHPRKGLSLQAPQQRPAPHTARLRRSAPRRGPQPARTRLSLPVPRPARRPPCHPHCLLRLSVLLLDCFSLWFPPRLARVSPRSPSTTVQKFLRCLWALAAASPAAGLPAPLPRVSHSPRADTAKRFAATPATAFVPVNI